MASGQWKNAQAESSSLPLTTDHWPLTTRGVPRRTGVTLLELLIVMTIMLMVTAAAIPVMMPALQNRRMREASRLTSSFISGARARAIETGRPAGVMLERFNGLPFAMQLSYVEVPPPYAGDALSSKITFNGSAQINYMGIPPAASAQHDNLWQGKIRIGDSIRLDYKGPLYKIASVGATSLPGQIIPTADPPHTTPWQLVDATGVAPPLPAGYANGVAYQIIRQPVRSSATPLQLPEGTVIDLVQSGTTTFPFPVTLNPVILFSPNGAVERVTRDATGLMMPPSGPIFLLTGRRDLMPDVTRNNVDENVGPDPADLVNATAYLSNFWVTIAPQTGQASVAENSSNLGPVADPSNYLQNARSFAQTPQSAGGR